MPATRQHCTGCPSRRRSPRPSSTLAPRNDPLEHQTARLADPVMTTHSAAGPTPNTAPPIVHEVLRGPGQPLPPVVRGTMEAMLGQDFADVQVHTGTRAGESAEAVSAQAYTVGRHVVFAPGRFEPDTTAGRRLLAHELTHAAGHRPAAPTPGGTLRISAPGDAAEQHATAVAEGRAALTTMATSPAQLHRQPAKVALTGISLGATLNGAAVATDRFTVPMESGVAMKATMAPSNATDVTLSILPDTAKIDAGTSIDNRRRDHCRRPARRAGRQRSRQPSRTARQRRRSFCSRRSPANSRARPRPGSAAPERMADCSGTPSLSPAGGATALEGSHVNEKFAAAKGTKLTFTGPPLADEGHPERQCQRSCLGLGRVEPGLRARVWSTRTGSAGPTTWPTPGRS